MQKNDYQKLRECPFCGEEAEIVEEYIGGKKKYRAECKKVDCLVEVFTLPFETKEEAIKIWNTRKGEQE